VVAGLPAESTAPQTSAVPRALHAGARRGAAKGIEPCQLLVISMIQPFILS